MKELEWSPNEKKAARKAFDKAHHSEIEEIKKSLSEKIQKIGNDKDVWELHDYLTERRLSIDDKYDYRYSKLIIVFGILLKEKYLTMDDLKELSKDKLELIKNISKGF